MPLAHEQLKQSDVDQHGEREQQRALPFANCRPYCH
jgi:hypothetical protein